MKVVDTARKIAEGATVAVILVTALPVAGPVGSRDWLKWHALKVRY